MIRNLFFDLDDTLLDFHRSEHDALKETLLAAGIPVTEALLARYAEINAGYWKRLERREVTRDKLKILRFRDLFAEIGADGADPAAICAAYEKRLGQQHHLIPAQRKRFGTFARITACSRHPTGQALFSAPVSRARELQICLTAYSSPRSLAWKSLLRHSLTLALRAFPS